MAKTLEAEIFDRLATLKGADSGQFGYVLGMIDTYKMIKGENKNFHKMKNLWHEAH